VRSGLRTIGQPYRNGSIQLIVQLKLMRLHAVQMCIPHVFLKTNTDYTFLNIT